MPEFAFKIVGYFDWCRSAAWHSRSPANSAFHFNAAPIPPPPKKIIPFFHRRHPMIYAMTESEKPMHSIEQKNGKMLFDESTISDPLLR